MPRLRNQDGIGKGISRLQLKLPTSISISAPIYSHRPYKRVCTYIGFSLYRGLSRSSPAFPSPPRPHAVTLFPRVPHLTHLTYMCVCVSARTRKRGRNRLARDAKSANAVCSSGRAKPHSFSAFCNSLLYDERICISRATIFHSARFYIHVPIYIYIDAS